MNENWKKIIIVVLAVSASFAAGFIIAKLTNSATIDDLRRTTEHALQLNKQLEEELLVATSAIGGLEESLRGSRTIAEQLFQQTQDLRGTIGELTTENSQLRSTVADLSRDLNFLRVATNAIGSSIVGFEDELGTIEKTLRELEQLINTISGNDQQP